MQKTIDTKPTLTPRQTALAQMVALILEWGEPEPTRADAANAPKAETRKREEEKRNEG
jgi:hypothetical protein